MKELVLEKIGYRPKELSIVLYYSKGFSADFSPVELMRFLREYGKKQDGATFMLSKYKRGFERTCDRKITPNDHEKVTYVLTQINAMLSQTYSKLDVKEVMWSFFGQRIV